MIHEKKITYTVHSEYRWPIDGLISLNEVVPPRKWRHTNLISLKPCERENGYLKILWGCEMHNNCLKGL